MKAKMKASAPIDPTNAWPMWIQMLIMSWIGVMSGPARKTMCVRLQCFEGRLWVGGLRENPGC
jgi:hypothetical protein